MALKILFTSVGRRVELMQAFHHAADKLNEKLIIYGADVSTTAPALFYCNKQIKVCKINDENYISQLLELCETNKINALIPTIDTDLLILSQNKEKFAEIGTKVIISEVDKIAICRDKRFTADFFISCGLNSPIPIDDYTKYNLGYPAFIKPKDGSSSVNAFKVNDYEDLEAKANNINDYIVQPFIDGVEYTVDIFCDFESNPIYIVPRERLAVRSGEVLQTRISKDKQIIDECKQIIMKFKPVGQITAQLIRDKKTGIDYYIEINPRFGGGAPLAIKAGADSAEATIKILNGHKMQYQENVISDNSVYSRFDQSVCVDFGEKFNIKAVIFDLDDTLYSEKDYVKSGFNAIENETGVSAEQLWNAFQEGKPAIDTVLKGMERMDIKYKCLHIYRHHIPTIKPYDGVIEMIKTLKSKGLFIGIITDGRPEGQKAKLQALNLQVDKVIITDEIGGEKFRKPCDIAFRIMKKHANVDFAQMIYVGDNINKDFIAPKQLGMQSVLFDNKDGLYQCNYLKTSISNPTEIINMIM